MLVFIQKYWNNNNCDYDVFIYYNYYRELYQSNEYEVNNKNIIKNIVE
jgi:hypothetical protein